MWQILDSGSLPSVLNPINILEKYARLDNTHLKSLIGDCFRKSPKERPSAAVLSQRLLDEFNKMRAKLAMRQKDVMEITNLKSKCRELIFRYRKQHFEQKGQKAPPPLMQHEGSVLTDSETSILFENLDSWNEPASLTLAPEMSFVIGAGLFWGFIDSKNVHEKEELGDIKALSGITSEVIY